MSGDRQLERDRYLSDPELARLLRAARERSHRHQVRDHALLALLANTAVRPGEALALKGEDFHVTEHEPRLRVRRLKKRWRAGVIDDLPISRGLARVLRRYLAAAAVAPGERAFPMTVRNLELLFKRYLKLAGILADFPLYALRHTALTRAYRRTGDLRLVQQLAGHASITTTQIYTHISQDDLRRSAELTGSIL